MCVTHLSSPPFLTGCGCRTYAVFIEVVLVNHFLLHAMAAVAEQEVRAISDRTKVALGVAKVRGVALGTSNPTIRKALLAGEAKSLQTPSSKRQQARCNSATPYHFNK